MMESNKLNTQRLRILLLMLVCIPVLFSCTKNMLPAESQPGTLKRSLSGSADSIQNSATGSISREEWDNITGNDVIDIPLQQAPTKTSPVSALEGPLNYSSSYGDRIRGYIYPPLTGSYTFWIAADDAAEFWLSTNDSSSNKVRIASLLSWTNFREWTKFTSQKSPSINLQAGQRYYLEVLHKQGGGGDNVSVQWQLPDGTIESPVPGSRLSPWIAENPAYTPSGTISLNNVHDITISGKSVSGGAVPCILLTNCYNIHITNNRISNSGDVGIHLYNCSNITIDHNFFTKVSSGVYAEQTAGGGIVVNNNQFLNMQGPFPRGQFVQFNTVSGPGSSISFNKGENILGQSYPEDAISLYQSNGTAASPLTISGNWIRGGGPSSSGGGIMLGDNGGSYLTASDNILVNPGEYGMAIAGGDHNTITNNKIFGVSQYFTNVGLFIDGINGQVCTNSTIGGNQVRYYNKTNYQNNAWIAPGTIRPTGWETNTFGAAIDETILPAVIITVK